MATSSARALPTVLWASAQLRPAAERMQPHWISNILRAPPTKDACLAEHVLVSNQIHQLLM